MDERTGKIQIAYQVLASEFGSHHAIHYLAAFEPSEAALVTLCRMHFRRTGVVHELDPKRLGE